MRDAPSGFNGFKVLWAAFIGAGIGIVLSIFLDTFIRNTPADIPPADCSISMAW